MDLFDEKLVGLAQSGDCRAFDALVSKYRARVAQLIYRFVRNEADAEDLVQDTFLRAYRALPFFRGEAAFYSWLHRIAINVAKTGLSMRARDEQVLSTESAGGEQIEDRDTPESLAVTDEIFAAVNQAISELCEEQRRVIVLCEIDGLSYRQVATAMSCPVGTVRSRVFRAREAIHLRVQRSFDEGLGRARSKRRNRNARGCNDVRKLADLTPLRACAGDLRGGELQP
ncbi:MAG TPA: sigma-70 family RNA polymerase sigma factor [Steroidobacteraceae bacterium]|nr:sigma-70 family RNA polymerase sigma factor [Steroidobacteraceae bacterium]